MGFIKIEFHVYIGKYETTIVLMLVECPTVPFIGRRNVRPKVDYVTSEMFV